MRACAPRWRDWQLNVTKLAVVVAEDLAESGGHVLGRVRGGRAPILERLGEDGAGLLLHGAAVLGRPGAQLGGDTFVEVVQGDARHHSPPPRSYLGRPSPRWAMMLRWISDVPAAIVLPAEVR